MLLEIILSAVFGMIGGISRASVGLFKAVDAKMKVDFRHWALTAAIAGVIGIVTGTVFSFEYRLAVLAGYSGLDLLEGIYKSFKVEKMMAKPMAK